MKSETCKLYSRAFWIFLPNIIKIYPYHFELYRFKVGPFFWDTVYIVAKRYVLEQKLLLTAQSHIGRMCGIDWYQNERPWSLFRGWLTSRRPMPHIRHWIWRKKLEIEAWFQRTTNIQCESKIPPEVIWIFSFFHKRLRIFNRCFTHPLYVLMHARLQIFMQLSLILTKLCHIKRDNLVHIICSHLRPKRVRSDVCVSRW